MAGATGLTGQRGECGAPGLTGHGAPLALRSPQAPPQARLHPHCKCLLHLIRPYEFQQRKLARVRAEAATAEACCAESCARSNGWAVRPAAVARVLAATGTRTTRGPSARGAPARLVVAPLLPAAWRSFGLAAAAGWAAVGATFSSLQSLMVVPWRGKREDGGLHQKSTWRPRQGGGPSCFPGGQGRAPAQPTRLGHGSRQLGHLIRAAGGLARPAPVECVRAWAG